MIRCLLIAIAGLAACGKGGTAGSGDLAASAQVEGGQVVVDVTCKRAFTVHYKATAEVPCDAKTPAHLAFPVTDLGAGTHELMIQAKDAKGEPATAYVEVAVPADVIGAQLVIAGCGSGSGSNVHIRVAGATDPTSCGLEPAFTTKLKLTEPAGVDVAVGSNKYIAAPSGPTEVDLDLADALLDLSVSDLHDPSRKLDIAWHVGASSGRLSADVDRPGPVMSKWLGDVATGAIPRPTFAAKSGALLAMLGTGVDSTEPKRPLREHKLLAIATRSDQKDLGTCKFTNDDVKTPRSHFGFDATIDVYDTTSWQKIATQLFPTATACPDKITLLVQKRPGDDRLTGDAGSTAVYSEVDWPAVLRWLGGDVTQPPPPPPAPAKPAKPAKPTKRVKAPGSTSHRRR